MTTGRPTTDTNAAAHRLCKCWLADGRRGDTKHGAGPSMSSREREETSQWLAAVGRSFAIRATIYQATDLADIGTFEICFSHPLRPVSFLLHSQLGQR